MPKGNPHPHKLKPGRPKGVPNKLTREMKEIHGMILDAIQKKYGIDYIVEKVSPRDLLHYLDNNMPKNMQIDANVSQNKINLSKLNDAELQQFKVLIGKMNDSANSPDSNNKTNVG